jgi:site-specific recombinase XerD
MENLSIRYVFDRKNIATETKQGLLQIEVRLNKTVRKVLISTGIHLYKNQFSEKNGFTCKNHPNSAQIAGKAKRIFNKIEAFCLSDDCPTFDYIKNWDKEPEKTHSVVEFIRKSLKERNSSSNVIEYHNSLIKRIEGFGKIKTFSDCTYENIKAFDAYLRKFIDSQPTLYKRHSALRRYILDAINLGICKYDPYRMFVVSKGKSKDPVFLDEMEIKKIIDYKPTTERMERVKDLFVFQMFTGMAYVDMCNFDKSYICKIDSIEVINSNRKKTNIQFTSILLKEARKILEKYDYKLPVLSNQKYNDYLKLLATGAEINKNITTHVGRHTYATYLMNKNIPLETISRAMGHSNIRMTQHYAKLLGKKVINDMKFLLE